MDNLKPCPFCAYDNADVIDWQALDHTEYAVLCLNCGAQGPNDLGKSGAREAWNRRRKEFPPCSNS